MYKLIDRGLLLLLFYISAITRAAFGSNRANIYKTSHVIPEVSMTNIILEDMKAAFNPITNNTRVIENVVAHMYQCPAKNSEINSAMIFQLPHTGFNRDNRQMERMLFMERRQFMEPTFPNLTESYMTLRRFRLSKAPLNRNISELMKKEMQVIEQQESLIKDPWSNLGLSGWNGDIAEPITTQVYRPRYKKYIFY